MFAHPCADAHVFLSRFICFCAQESAVSYAALQAAHTAALEKSAKLEALLQSLKIPVDEKGNLRDDVHIRPERRWRRGRSRKRRKVLWACDLYTRSVVECFHR